MLKSCKNKNLTRHKKIAPAKNNAEVIFNEQKKNGDKAIIDLTRFISPETAKFDPDGSYTGVPNEVFYNNVTEEPVQDADDL